MRFIDITMTLDTSAYASGDVLAETQAFSLGNPGLLKSITLIDEDDQKMALDIFFFSENVSFGTENAAPSITDANARKYLGTVPIATGDYKDLGGVSVANIRNIDLVLANGKEDANCYVAILNGSGAPTYTATGLKMRLGIQD